ncbi:MAG TPA: hypothetical protein VG755_30590 [Nannocystaceae bacterium]|nr:hypothetical protein [Nannocystaceae bacterium]
MSCPDVARSPSLLFVALVCVAVPSCKDPAPSNAETTSSSSTTGEPPPTPCDREMPCAEEGEMCLNGFCYDGPAPTISIESPIDQQQLPWDAASMTQPVTVTVKGSGLTLVAAADNPTAVNGEGQVVLTLDNFEVAVIESGDLEAGIPIEVETDALAGAHRLRAFMRQSDETPYDNPESSFNSLFWFDDGLPHVAFNSPLPGEKFPIGAQVIEVTIGTINFELAPAAGTPDPGRKGHAHIFVDQEFPACALDPECHDNAYVKVLAPTTSDYEVTGPVDIPSATGAKTKVTALLVRTDHTQYCMDDLDPCVPVFETITIGRMDPVEEPETSSGGADSTGAGTGGTGTGTGG